MSTLVRTSLMSGLAALRHEPTAKRIRAMVGENTVVDSTRAILLWEPRRVVPSWAVPVGDVRAELRPAAGRDAPADPDAVGHRMPEVSARPVLDPSIPFAFHTASGRPVDVVAEAAVLPAAGFLLDDADLSGYLVLDFAAFDRWWEEDEQNLGHPRDPFHRIDILQSSRNVRIEHRGVVLAESTEPSLLFETLLPMRCYLPREDVIVPLESSTALSTCAYKGHARYFSCAAAEDRLEDIAWSYESPLREAEQIRGLIAFYGERLDVFVDGVAQERPRTPWSRSAAS